MFNQVIQLTMVFSFLTGIILTLFLTAEKKNLSRNKLSLKKQH